MPQFSTPSDTVAFSGVAQALMGDRRYIAAYEGERHVPYPIPAPLTEADCRPFFDFDGDPVTFTAKVPLTEVARGRDAIVEHLLEHAFAFPVQLQSCEFRALGASFSDFSNEFCGDVHLQVTCFMTQA